MNFRSATNRERIRKELPYQTPYTCFNTFIRKVLFETVCVEYFLRKITLERVDKGKGRKNENEK